MQIGKAVLGSALAVSLGTWGCATKKHVREAIAPVQEQVASVQKETAANKTAIGDLDRSVATADEKATDAGKRAGQAADAAAKANSAAMMAQQRADAANSLAQQAQEGVGRVDKELQNLDNYHLVNTQQVFFRTGQSTLDKQAQADLDNAVQNVMNQKGYIIEVEGFADRTGSKAYNAELARRRADAVVRYLSVNHNVPLRGIRELGVGSDFPNAVNKTRADRKANRRVDVKVYALDITGTAAPTQATTSTGTNQTGQSDRVNNTDQMPRQTTPRPPQQ